MLTSRHRRGQWRSRQRLSRVMDQDGAPQGRAASTAGLFYVSASGTKLHNLGDFMLKLITSDGTSASIMLQVANMNKPLAIVANINKPLAYDVFNRHNGKDAPYLLHR